ncbi:MAG: BtpA/SgcQ family protein [Halodesulfurarchaeum sp.]
MDFAETRVIGMVHLDPLPGSPRHGETREAIRERALSDARTLEEEGVDGVLMENFGDTPYHPDSVPKHVVAELTAIGRALQDALTVPLGVNVLRNDAVAALSVAAAVEADFIRVNVHTGVRVTDQGILEGSAHETLRLRDRLSADVDIWADVDVKHSTAIGDRPLSERIDDLVTRGLADAVIVSGSRTGSPPSTDTLSEARAALGDPGTVPLVVGSGVTPETARPLLDIADGAIVGTSLEEGGDPGSPVSPERVSALLSAIE